MKKVVIVGGGQSACQSAVSLRQGGFDGAITLVSKENRIPYQRPPLSKGFLKGVSQEKQLYFRPEEWYVANEVCVRLEAEAAFVNRADQFVLLGSGEKVYYDVLILATGSVPKRLPNLNAKLEGMYYLATADDAMEMRDKLLNSRSVAIIGGGFIGLEVAASARALGLDVVVVEAENRVLARVAGSLVSEYFTKLHLSHGVDLRTGTVQKVIKSADGTVTGIVMSNGDELDADLVVVGIGSNPNVNLAEAAGLQCDGGIVVNQECRTSDPNIFAAGDCCSRFYPRYDRWIRLESVHNAIEQAKIVAASITKQGPPKVEVPWFWTDQFDTKLQIAGLRAGADENVVRGNTGGHRFSVFYFKNQTVAAVEAVNCPDDFVIGRKLIEASTVVDPKRINDSSESLKAILLA